MHEKAEIGPQAPVGFVQVEADQTTSTDLRSACLQGDVNFSEGL